MKYDGLTLMLDQAKIDELRAIPVEKQGLFIDGKAAEPRSGADLPVISPIDGTILTTIADAGGCDVDAAVFAARRSFEAGVWSRMPPTARKAILHRVADLIEKRATQLAVLGVRDNGTEIGMALKAEPLGAAATFRYYAEALDKVYGEIAPVSNNILGLIHREAVGVVGAIVPWNMPLMIGAWKLAPALAVGNSVVLKPAENASLALLALAGICAEAGLPDGVLNVVTGRGATTGAALASHMDVDALVFTGSNDVGRRLLEYSAGSNLKRVYLELGGKSPNIMFADAPDLDRAIAVSANGIFRNSGQVCVAGSRLLLEKSIAKEATEKIVKMASELKVGDPLDLRNDIGAINSIEHLEKILSCCRQAVEAGVHQVLTGKRILTETGGFYLRPSVFDNVAPDSALATREVFGPVLAVIPFENEEEAIKIANATEFGLAAGVWTSNLSRAHRMVRAVKAGIVHVNTYGGADGTVPLGGHKQSGNGHDKSLHALDKYVNLKTAWIQL